MKYFSQQFRPQLKQNANLQLLGKRGGEGAQWIRRSPTHPIQPRESPCQNISSQTFFQKNRLHSNITLTLAIYTDRYTVHTVYI
jgi:hypothetical protein